jgi:hypothetical protein
MNRDKEIDLIKVVSDLIQFVKSNKLTLTFFLLVGLSFGVYSYFLKSSSHQVVKQNTIVLDSKIVSNEIISSIINVINQEDLQSKSSKMKVSINEANQILGIDSKIVSYTLKTNDSTLNSMIEVNLRYDSNLKLNKLLKGVLSYISSNDYLIKKQKVRVIEAESEVAYLKDLINKLSTSNKLIYNLTSLIDRKIELENFIKTNEIVEVISVNSPSIYDSQIGFKGKILRVVLLSVLGLSLGFFFLYIKKFRSAYLLRN